MSTRPHHVKRLLLQLDTSSHPSAFDRIVGFDGGADDVLSYGDVTAESVRDLVHGAIFTRGPQDLHNTAIFVGGTDVDAAQRVFAAVCETFFGPFRVSAMLDANGANTTTVAAVTRVVDAVPDLAGRRAVVLGGGGPVGSRVAGLLASSGARVLVTSRKGRGGELADRVRTRCNVDVSESVVGTPEQAGEAVEGADIVINASAAGSRAMTRAAWAHLARAAVLVDLNAVPPAGIEGVEPGDKATVRNGVTCFGAIGVGGLKMKLHRACISAMFERNDLVLDVDTIAELARGMRTPPVPGP